MADYMSHVIDLNLLFQCLLGFQCSHKLCSIGMILLSSEKSNYINLVNYDAKLARILGTGKIYCRFISSVPSVDEIAIQSSFSS